MRTYTLLYLLFFLLTSVGYSQFLQPIEKKLDIDKKVTPAWVLTVDEPEDALRESFIDYTKEKLNVKFKKSKRDLLMAEEVRVPSISSYAGDLKIQLSTVGGGTQVAVAFMPGYDIALNSQDYPQEMERLRQYVRNMVKYHKVNELQDKIAEDEKRVRQLESSLKKNHREYRRLDKQSERMERKAASSKTEESDKFKLKNDIEAAQDRMVTLTKTAEELEDEIAKVNEKVQVSQAMINDIENRFIEPEVTVTTEPEQNEYKP